MRCHPLLALAVLAAMVRPAGAQPAPSGSPAVEIVPTAPTAVNLAPDAPPCAPTASLDTPLSPPSPAARADEPGGFNGFGGGAGVGGLGGFGGFGGPGGLGVGAAPVASYRVTWLPSERVTNQDGARLGFVEQDLSVTGLLWGDGKDSVLGRVNVRSQLFQTDALLPGMTQPFPDQFWNVSLGVTEVHRFDNGWLGGLAVSGGSASNKPFQNASELNANVLAFLRVPVRETDAWNFSLAYSPLGQLPFPIPGVSYFWHPSDRFWANIGLPFQLHYRPLDDLALDFSYMLLTTVHARATYRLADPLRVWAGFNWINQGYHLSTDTESAARFFYYEMNVAGGVRWILCRNASLDFSAGYAFDRFYSEGRIFGNGDNARVDVAPGPFVSGQFALRW
jgi:hypothetical protein